MSLPEPFPSAPNRKAVVHFYCSVLLRGEVAKRIYSIGFANLYAAKRWLEHMMGDETAARTGPTLRLDSSGIHLRCYELDKVLSYEYRSKEEETWPLPDQEARMIARFRRGTWFSEARDQLHEEEKLIIKPSKVSVKTTTKKAVMPDGYVKVADLCKGTAVKPMNARALLRSIMAKPDYGWAFPQDRLPEIKKIIGV